MVKGTTKEGFKFEFDEEKINDMRFVELLAEMDENFAVTPKVLNQMLGKEQKEALYKFYETEDGRVPVESVTAAVEEMFAAGEDAKN